MSEHGLAAREVECTNANQMGKEIPTDASGRFAQSNKASRAE